MKNSKIPLKYRLKKFVENRFFSFFRQKLYIYEYTFRTSTCGKKQLSSDNFHSWVT